MNNLFFILKELPFNIKMSFQRLLHGHSASDLWGLNTTITGFILPRLISYRDMEKHGVPVALEFVDCEDAGNISRDSKSYSYDDVDNAILEWNKIIDKMIWSFKFKQCDGCCNDPEFSYYQDGKYSKEKFIELQEKHNIGMELFSKYYDNLWD